MQALAKNQNVLQASGFYRIFSICREVGETLCGIAGIRIPAAGKQCLESQVRTMSDRLEHRGPDDFGIYARPGIALGHRRLSIIDISGGHQPFINRKRDLVLVYNGEIYNYREIRTHLESVGYHFDTASDTEVLISAWEQYGVDCLQMIKGMFAFAIWSEQRQELYLVRDRIGIKPLYYCELRNGGLAFASELKGILACDVGLDKRLDDSALLDYLTLGYIPPGKSVFSGIRQLKPGHYLRQDKTGLRVQQRNYWRLQIDEHSPPNSQNASNTIWPTIRSSVGSQLVADVPVAVFLSGGLDSSAVTTAMSLEYETTTTAYSIGFGEEGFDESKTAAQLASNLGLDHRVRNVDISDSLNVRKIASIYDEPFGDASSVPTVALCEFASERHKVALSGDGGDEVFAGYPWYFSFEKRFRLQNAFFGGLVRGSAAAASRILSMSQRYFARVRGYGFLSALASDPIGGYVMSQSLYGNFDYRGLLADELQARLKDYDVSDQFRDLAHSSGLSSPIAIGQFLDFHMYLPGDILTKVDRASMASSLEVRVPLLDEDLVREVSCLSRAVVAPNSRRKGLLVDSLRDVLPPEIIGGPKKGFSIPVDDWFCGKLGRDFERRLDAVESSRLLRSILNLDRVRGLLSAHTQGGVRAGPMLWALYCLIESLDIQLDLERA